MSETKMARRISNPPPTPLASIVTFKHPFNMGVRVGNAIFTGGTVAFDDNGDPIAPDDLVGQTAPCLEYTKRIVTDLGGSMDDVANFSTFCEVSEGWQDATRVEMEYFRRGAVATAVGGGINAPHLVMECESIAFVGEPKRFADPAGHYPAIGAPNFHHGVRTGNLVFVAGQVALDKDGNVLHRGDMPGQTRVVMENLTRVLRDLGADVNDLVSLKTFYVGNEGWEESVKARAEYLDSGPTNSSVRTSALSSPDLLIQIEAVAMVDSAKEYVNPTGRPAPVEAPFHHGVRCENMFFVGAQGALDAEGRVLHPGDIVAQTPIAMDNLKHVVDVMGSDMDDVVVYHTYYVGRDKLGETIPLRSSYFKHGRGPVARGVIFEGLPDPNLKIAFGVIGMAD